jgi:hypothetical protein
MLFYSGRLMYLSSDSSTGHCSNSALIAHPIPNQNEWYLNQQGSLPGASHEFQHRPALIGFHMYSYSANNYELQICHETGESNPGSVTVAQFYPTSVNAVQFTMSTPPMNL